MILSNYIKICLVFLIEDGSVTVEFVRKDDGSWTAQSATYRCLSFDVDFNGKAYDGCFSETEVDDLTSIDVYEGTFDAVAFAKLL